MYNTLIERDLWSMKRRKKAMTKINPILNKLVDAVITHGDNMDIIVADEKLETEQLIREYVEVDVWDWCALIVLNVLPKENKELFDAFKKVFTEYGVKEYKKENDADSKKRKLRANFDLFKYKSYKDNYKHDYSIDIIFRGNLPETCRLEYEEHYEEVISDNFIVQNGKVMKKEVEVKVICDESSILKPVQINA